MTCREFIELLDQWVEAGVQPDDRTRCETHLDECPYCRDYLETYKITIDLLKGVLRDIPDAEVPPAVIEGLRKAIRAARGS